MPIIGERYTKLQGERGKLSSQLEIKSNIDLVNIELRDLGVAAENKKGLAFSYKFSVKYGEDAGNIVVEGEIYYIDDNEKMKEIADKWEKNKELDRELRVFVMNHFLELGYMQAILIADKLRLPPPIQFPRFVDKTKKKK